MNKKYYIIILMTNYINNDEQQKLADIKNLQDAEMELYKYLETNIVNGNLTEEQQNDILSKIKQISDIKLELYDTLNDNYLFYTKNMDSLAIVLKQQIEATRIIEEELNRKKMYIKKIQENNNNKLRLIEINTYYGKKYEDYINIVKIIFVFLFLSVIIYKFGQKSDIANMIILFFGVLTTIIVLYRLYVMNKKSAFDYDQYNFKPYTSGSSSSSSNSSSDVVIV